MTTQKQKSGFTLVRTQFKGMNALQTVHVETHLTEAWMSPHKQNGDMFFTLILHGHHRLPLYWNWVEFFASVKLQVYIGSVVSRKWLKFQFCLSHPFNGGE